MRIKPFTALTAASFLFGSLTFAHSAHAGTLVGGVLAVADGDTETILDQSKAQHRVRLAHWVGSMDANLNQVRRGMAWVYRKYARDPLYFRVEEEARAARRGLWADPNRVPPWEWRRQ
jgi:endonuclease YncB( thermonuclease family)